MWNTIGNVERGRTRPHRQTLDKLAWALRLNVDQRAELLIAWRTFSTETTDPAIESVRPIIGGAVCPDRSARGRFYALPSPANALIGREREVAAVTDRLRSTGVRLLTLIGPGGIGKTRLAIQAATELADLYADGACFVELAPISDPGLVAAAIAQALGVPDASSNLRATLRDFLAEKHLLLVLDNFEHLLPAAELVSALLSEARGLSVLATSREALSLSGEQALDVPPLQLPSRSKSPELEQLSQYEAVRLFVDRARAVKTDFRLTSANAAVVVEICHRLDGLPLAIELAAARVRHAAPAALLPLLDRRLPLLTGGARDAPARHRTLRGAIAWSYDLLSVEERALFRRLSVFAGGCSLEAARAVAMLDGAASAIDVLDDIASLVDKSLVRSGGATSGAARYTMLETVREFGLEQLADVGEEAAIRARHADYFEAQVQQAAPHFLREEQLEWLARMDDELDNLRVVLQFLLDTDQRERGQLLAGSLWYFWSIHSRVSEGHQWLTGLLAGPPGHATSAQARARALFALGHTAQRQYDGKAEIAAFTECLELARNTGDEWIAAVALVRCANALDLSETWAGLVAPYRLQPDRRLTRIQHTSTRRRWPFFEDSTTGAPPCARSSTRSSFLPVTRTAHVPWRSRRSRSRRALVSVGCSTRASGCSPAWRWTPATWPKRDGGTKEVSRWRASSTTCTP
jgi:predicted ATPase